MKKVLMAATVFLVVFSGCIEKKSESPKTVETSLEKKAEATKSPDITEKNFEKGKNVHGLKMVSLINGETIDFSQFKGKKIMFDFWSSWCEPCIAMFPVINKLKTELEDKEGSLKILSISVDPMKGKVKEIVKEKNVLFEVLNAPESLANSGILMPFTVIADENGKIIATSSGKHTYEEFLKMLGK